MRWSWARRSAQMLRIFLSSGDISSREDTIMMNFSVFRHRVDHQALPPPRMQLYQLRYTPAWVLRRGAC